MRFAQPSRLIPLILKLPWVGGRILEGVGKQMGPCAISVCPQNLE